MKDQNRVSMAQAARELCTTPETLRLMMAYRKVNIGDCYRKPGAKRRTYRIYRTLLDAAKKERGYT